MTEYYREVLKKNPAYGNALEHVLETHKGQLSEIQVHYLHTFAPVICEYALWVLNEAKKNGIDRLYFLSRDGYPVYQAACILSEGNDSYPQLRYLRVSRYSLRIPEMVISKETFTDYLFLSGIDVTMRKILKRGGLSDEEIEEIASEIGYTDPIDKIISRPEILYWKKIADKEKETIWSLIYKHAKPQLPLILEYFRQEGLMDDVRIAIVDSGWVGTTQRSIKRLISVEKPGFELEGYYFGLYSLPKDVGRSRYHTFYFRPWKDIEKKVLFSNCLFEAVISEASGMTLSYRKEGDVVIPEQTGGSGLNSCFLNDILRVLIAYADTLKGSISGDNRDNRVRISGAILTKLMAYPETWEAENYGKLQFCDDVLESGAQDIAADLLYEDIKNLRLLRKLRLWIGKKLHIKSRVINDTTLHESGWLYASIVRCRGSVRWSLNCARMYQRLMYYRKELTRD